MIVRRIELYQSEDSDAFTHMKRLQSGFKKINTELLELDKHVVIEKLCQQLTEGIMMLLQVDVIVASITMLVSCVKMALIAGMTSLDRRIDELKSQHSSDVQRLDRSISELEQLAVHNLGRRLEDVEGKLSIYDLISEQMSMEREKVTQPASSS